MTTLKNVLIVDDHPFIIEVYKNAFIKLSNTIDGVKFNIHTANNCQDAIEEINNANGCSAFDIIVLDMSLPKSSSEEFLSGEDIGMYYKKKHPEGKTIVITALNDNYRLHCILNNLNPDGFLIKSDMSMSDLTNCIHTVLIDPPFYSKTIVKLMRRNLGKEFMLDEIDRKLLYKLSIGARIKDLTKDIPLSVGGLERRKRRLLEEFRVDKNDEKTLIELAREKGFI